MFQPPEETQQGKMSAKIYFQFFQAGGILASIIVLILLVLGEVRSNQMPLTTTTSYIMNVSIICEYSASNLKSGFF